MHSTVRGTSSVRGPPLAFSPPLAPSPLAPPLLLPPPLGPSSLLPSLSLLAPTKPAPPKPDITEGARQGEDDRRAQARTLSPCTCALQKLSGSLVQSTAEQPLSTSISLIMHGGGDWDIPPHCVLISFFLITEYWLLIGHWRQQRIRNQESENVLRCKTGLRRMKTE
jgi:hypothetical protein